MRAGGHYHYVINFWWRHDIFIDSLSLLQLPHNSSAQLVLQAQKNSKQAKKQKKQLSSWQSLLSPVTWPSSVSSYNYVERKVTMVKLSGQLTVDIKAS